MRRAHDITCQPSLEATVLHGVNKLLHVAVGFATVVVGDFNVPRAQPIADFRAKWMFGSNPVRLARQFGPFVVIFSELTFPEFIVVFIDLREVACADGNDPAGLHVEVVAQLGTLFFKGDHHVLKVDLESSHVDPVPAILAAGAGVFESTIFPSGLGLRAFSLRRCAPVSRLRVPVLRNRGEGMAIGRHRQIEYPM